MVWIDPLVCATVNQIPNADCFHYASRLWRCPNAVNDAFKAMYLTTH